MKRKGRGKGRSMRGGAIEQAAAVSKEVGGLTDQVSEIIDDQANLVAIEGEKLEALSSKIGKVAKKFLEGGVELADREWWKKKKLELLLLAVAMALAMVPVGWVLYELIKVIYELIKLLLDGVLSLYDSIHELVLSFSDDDKKQDVDHYKNYDDDTDDDTDDTDDDTDDNETDDDDEEHK